MPDLQLTDDPFIITGTDGKKYTIIDPLDVMLELSSGKLLTEGGGVATDADSLSKIREVFRKACGIPTLTFFQMMAVVKAMTDFMDGLQKKMQSTPKTPPSMDSSLKAQIESATTATSPAFEH